MKTPSHLKSIASAVLIGLLSSGANLAFAENEPTDNTYGGASPVALGTNGSPAISTGFISNSDTDYYQITNTAGYTSIVVTFAFSGSGPDTCRLAVFGPGGEPLFNELTETGINPFQQTYTISNPAKGAVYHIGCLGNSADGNKSYTLTIDPSPNLDLLGQIAKLEATIEKYKSSIIKLESAMAQGKKDLKKANAKLKAAKTLKTKLKITKQIAAIKKTYSGWKLKLVKSKLILENLEEDLLELQEQL